MSKSVFFQITGTGTHETVHESVSFTVKANKTAKTSVKAKGLVKAIETRIRAAVAKLENDGVMTIVPRTLVTSMEVNEVQKYDQETQEQVHHGYRASYACSFTTKDVDKVSVIQDVLTSDEDAGVEDPNFTAADSEAAKQTVLDAAYADVEGKLKAFCKTLGLNHNDFMIVSVQQHGQRGIARAQAASLEAMPAGGAAAPPIEIIPGKAILSETISVSYVRKGALD